MLLHVSAAFLFWKHLVFSKIKNKKSPSGVVLWDFLWSRQRSNSRAPTGPALVTPCKFVIRGKKIGIKLVLFTIKKKKKSKDTADGKRRSL